MKRQANCSIEGCSRDYYLGGYCSVHYNRKIRHGDPLGGRAHVNGDVAAWLVAHIGHDGDDCLIWPFARSKREGRAVGTFDLPGHGKMHDPCTYLLTATKGPKPEPGMQAAHGCGKAHEGCVNPKHLRWATPLGNIADKKVHGTQNRGEMVATAKITPEIVRAIRASKRPDAHLAAEYGLSPSTVGKARKGKTWAHVS